ncbi:solute carrier family 22 member 2-like, partial [Ostrinia furnacalis]|uniref:solute carrier family 22 member 2-like n=1 Tax=Ostrinia furnacalis TaxID=93504 RepID=UPI00103CC027
IGTIYEDVTTEVLGNIGIWQWLVVVASTVLAVPSMFNQYEDMFLLKPSLEVICIPPERYEVLNASLCTVTSINNAAAQLKCGKWHVKLFWLIWLKKSWLVFCDNKMKLLSTTMISRMGLMFGCVMFGLIADSCGRRMAIAINLFVDMCMGLIMTFCDSQPWFQLLVFLKSLFGAATLYMGLVITCEIASNRWRSRLNAIASVPQLLSMTCMLPLANAFPNLETYNFMATLFSVLLIIILRWIPESPQWLLYNRKIIKAEKILYEAAKRNGTSLCEDFKIRPVNHRAYHCLDEIRTCSGIFTRYNVRVLILVSLLLWSLTYFQLSYIYATVLKEDNSNQYLFALMSSVVGLVSLTILLSRKILIRHLLILNIIISGISASAEVILGHITIFHAPKIFSIFALASGIVVHLLLLNITPRLFAINIRATLFGCCHAIGQLGSMFSYLFFVFQPFSNEVSVVKDVVITAVLISLSLILLDIDGREMPDVIDDMDYFSELSKPLRWATQKTNSPSHEEVEMRIYSFGSSGRQVSHPHSLDRLPAQRIGFGKFRRSLFANIRRIFSRNSD